MKLLKRAFDWVMRARKGQTMAEYAIIVAAIAVLVFGVYQELSSIGIAQGVVQQVAQDIGL
ncbi:MAG: hypothetical protein ACREQI_08500 [Candidatus Binataceae bacterium]